MPHVSEIIWYLSFPDRQLTHSLKHDKTRLFYLVLLFSVYRASSINTNGNGIKKLDTESGPANEMTINETRQVAGDYHRTEDVRGQKSQGSRIN